MDRRPQRVKDDTADDTPVHNPLRRLAQIDSLNFWLTNRIPRVAATRFMGWYSRIDSPWLTRISLSIWQIFTTVDLADSPAQHYRSLRDVFTRPLLPGRRSFDAERATWCSPSDAIVGANGRVHQGLVLQAKGAPYALSELLGSAELAKAYDAAHYVTLRLTSGMYHRFHAPCDLTIVKVDYISGDVFNVNPPALRRIPSLFCRNERAVIHCVGPDGQAFLIVAVAAILVASIQLHCLPERMSLKLPGNTVFDCDHAVGKGDELGWFEQGSTLILLVPGGLQPSSLVGDKACIKAGNVLFHSPPA